MYRLKVSETVLEVRESLQKLTKRGFITEEKMTKIVKRFAEQKRKAEEGQRYIIIMENELN